MSHASTASKSNDRPPLCMWCRTEYMQNLKASKVEGGQANNSSQKNTLLQQLGLVPAAVDHNTSTSSSNTDEKTDNQTEGEKREETDGAADPFLPVNRPQQKNKKKCWICKSKLELAQRELGSCKCGEYGGWGSQGCPPPPTKNYQQYSSHLCKVLSS